MTSPHDDPPDDEAGLSVSGPTVAQRREWGRIGARRRWEGHAARTVRLDDLPEQQRAVVRALVEMVRAPRTEKPAA